MEEGLRRSQIRSENLVGPLSWRQPAFLLRSPQPWEAPPRLAKPARSAHASQAPLEPERRVSLETVKQQGKQAATS